jgi:hypothetical protein
VLHCTVPVGETRSPRRVSPNVEEVPSAGCPIVHSRCNRLRSGLVAQCSGGSRDVGQPRAQRRPADCPRVSSVQTRRCSGVRGREPIGVVRALLLSRWLSRWIENPARGKPCAHPRPGWAAHRSARRGAERFFRRRSCSRGSLSSVFRSSRVRWRTATRGAGTGTRASWNTSNGAHAFRSRQLGGCSVTHLET